MARQDEDYEEDYEEEYEEDSGHEYEEEATLSAALSAQLKAAPWYMGSVAFHLVIFLLLMLVPAPPRKKKKKRVVITTTMEEEEEQVFEDPPEQEKVESTEVTTNTEVTVDVPQVTTDIKVEMEVEVVQEQAQDEPVEMVGIGDVGQASEGPKFVGVSGGGGGGKGRFGARIGKGRRRATRRGGGSAKTEASVEMALQWLAAHQEPNGQWSAKKNGVEKSSLRHDVGITSLAVLAFLGAGNSTKYGKYRNNVRKGVEWVMSQQGKNKKYPGCVGDYSYANAIAMMALSEAYGMSDDKKIKGSAQAMVDFAVKGQCPDSYGWDYKPENTARVDTSVAGWVIMGLKSAKVGGLKVPTKVFKNARKFFYGATDPKKGTAFYALDRGKDKDPKPITMDDVKAYALKSRSLTMSAVCLTCLQFLGASRDDDYVQATARYSIKHLPNPNGSLNFYLGYYQALGFFQLGIRSREWRTFVGPLVNYLLTKQIQTGTVQDKKGSWDFNEKTHCEANWGRVGQTAVGALMLEVFYRYADAHKHKLF